MPLFFWFFTESWWGANKGLGEALKSCTRKEHGSATNSIAKGGQGAIAPCRVQGQRPLWGLGQRPNSSTGDQYAKRAQQRCRQRSAPASNSARPQTRLQAALPPRFGEEPFFSCSFTRLTVIILPSAREFLRLSYQVQHHAKKGKTLRALCVRMKLPHTN